MASAETLISLDQGLYGSLGILSAAYKISDLSSSQTEILMLNPTVVL